jgi:hypothetical protein
MNHEIHDEQIEISTFGQTDTKLYMVRRSVINPS